MLVCREVLAMSILLRAAVSFLTVVGGLFIVPAGAASVCQGSYTASSIRSLPQPATIELASPVPTQPTYVSRRYSLMGYIAQA